MDEKSPRQASSANLAARSVFASIGFMVALFGPMTIPPADSKTVVVHPGLNAIGYAVEASSDGDSLLVMPGVYFYEIGSEIRHSLTIIGVGGASQNEVEICSDLCATYLFDVVAGSGSVITIEGLSVTRSDLYPGPVHGIRLQTLGLASIRKCIFHDVFSRAIIVFGSGPFPPRIESNLFSGNEIGVIFVQGGQAYITGNTFVSGTTGIILNDGATPVIANNIFSNTYAGVVCNPSKPPPQPDFACNDAWNNTLGSYVGCIDPTGSDGNIAQDPLFCDVQNDYRLRSKSPCLPEHSPTDCGLIGAFGACMATTVSEAVPAPERSFFSVESNPVSYGPVFLMDDFQDVAAIEIYAANGRLTAVLHSKAPRVQWAPPAAQPRGVYFARAVTATGGSIVKFVLVR